jgi:hypothetical protein
MYRERIRVMITALRGDFLAKVIPDTAKNLSETSNVVLNRKHALFNSILSHNGWTKMQRMLTADWSQEQACNDAWK